ncbi:MAG TPA: VWA domain-containing protein [Pirellulaceae bacterium]|nr:VWA domain-containing protein [Pirellulaceae bacterium]
MEQREGKKDRDRAVWLLPLPIWLIAIAVHLFLLTLGAIFIKFGRPGADGAKVERPVAALVAEPIARQVEYFAEEKPAPPQSPPAAEGSANAPNGSTLGAAIPSGLPPVLPGVSLPQLPGGLPPADDLVGVAAPGGPAKRVSILPELGDAEILAADAAIPREVVPTGPTAQLSLFGSAAAEGRSFVFVIDRSQSMGGGGLGAIQAASSELKARLGQLTEQQTFQVVAYNQQAVYFTEGGLIPATDDNKRRLVKFVEDIAAYGQTEHTRGLLAALRLRPEVIFLLTDAGDPVMKPADLHVVREATRGRTSIHCLHFGRGKQESSENFLARLAAENRGSYTYIDMNAR